MDFREQINEVLEKNRAQRDSISTGQAERRDKIVTENRDLRNRVDDNEDTISTLESESTFATPTSILHTQGVNHDSGGIYSGTSYTPYGDQYINLTAVAKPWLKYDMSTNIISEEIGPPSEPWGGNEKWRLKADFSGAVYF